MNKNPQFVVDDLSAGYGDFMVVQHAKLNLCKGEIVSIIGANASGKSTFIKAVFNLVPEKKGDVFLGDQKISNLPTFGFRDVGLAYVPQIYSVFLDMSVQENLYMGLFGKPVHQQQIMVKKLQIWLPSLGRLLKRKARVLSGGERQLVAIGRALMCQPTYIFLDEPTAGLSLANSERIFRLLEKLRREGLGVLIIEHKVQKILKLSNRAYVFREGCIAFSGLSEELITNKSMLMKLFY